MGSPVQYLHPHRQSPAALSQHTPMTASSPARRAVCNSGPRHRRPTILTNGPRTGAYRVLVDPRDWTSGFISRGFGTDFISVWKNATFLFIAVRRHQVGDSFRQPRGPQIPLTPMATLRSMRVSYYSFPNRGNKIAQRQPLYTRLSHRRHPRHRCVECTR